jgi:hypothetical protein
LHLSPCKEKGTSNWVPGHGGGAAQPIAARPAALPAMQGRGEEGMLTKGPLALGTWAGRHPTAAHGGDQRGRPRWPQLRRVQRTGWTTRDARGTRRSFGRHPNNLVARTSQTNSRRRRRPWRVARQWRGGSAWRTQGRAATLNRRSAVTACQRRRCRRGMAASRPTHVRRRAGRTGGPPGARRVYGVAARRHARG